VFIKFDRDDPGYMMLQSVWQYSGIVHYDLVYGNDLGYPLDHFYNGKNNSSLVKFDVGYWSGSS